jgi:DNA mismatch repair protein PMS2
MLNKIDNESILQICSNQVVTDLKGAMKELVENSIDAAAQKIEIKFFQYGLDGIEVADDGKGIHEDDYDIIAKRGTTSKISELEDIYRIKSLGFRGEALSSLCALSELSISTKREEDTFGHILEFNERGDLIKKTQIARNVSKLSQLFRQELPYESKTFSENCQFDIVNSKNPIKASFKNQFPLSNLTPSSTPT